MGLDPVFAVALSVILIGCTPKSAVTLRNKYYIDCCNPALNASDKDMCKWAKGRSGKNIIQKNNLYEMIWSDCKIGEEPWGKWE